MENDSIRDVTDSIYDTLFGNVEFFPGHVAFPADEVKEQFCDSDGTIIFLLQSGEAYKVSVERVHPAQFFDIE